MTQESTPARIQRLSAATRAKPRMPDYYLDRSTQLGRLLCALAHFPFLLFPPGHAYEQITARDPDRLEVEGEGAFVCHRCWKVHDRGPFIGFVMEVSFGSSPSRGRIPNHRRVDDVGAELDRLNQHGR